MGQKEKALIALLLAGIFVINLAEANFTYHQDSIKTNYWGGEIIRGKVNLSFDNIPSDAMLNSSLGGSTRLYDLLISNGYKNGVEYTCSTNNCKNQYSASTLVKEF